VTEAALADEELLATLDGRRIELGIDRDNRLLDRRLGGRLWGGLLRADQRGHAQHQTPDQ
jgi:hypothetical protein